MNSIYIKIFLGISILFPILGYSQVPGEYLEISAANNPGLRSKYSQYHALLERVPQVGALPDPQLSFGFFIMPMERFMGNQVAEISIMQMFPWFGALGAARDEASQMAKAKYEEFNEAKSMLFYEVKATWYALYLLEKEIAITEENIQILASLEQIALSRFKSGGQGGGGGSQGKSGMKGPGQESSNSERGMGSMNMQEKSNTGAAPSRSRASMGEMSSNMSGNGSMVDVLRVQMEINELRNNLALLQDSKIPLLARFNRLLNRAPAEAVIMPDSIKAAPLPVPLAEMPDSIRKNNPMLKMLEKEEEAFLAQGKMNRKMGFPMIGLGLQYGIFRPRPGGESMMNGRNMLMPMATATIPLWRKKYNASVREAGYLREALAEQRQEAGNQLLVDYEEALKDFKDAERRYKLYQNQTALANQVLNLLTVQYTTAGSDFEEVLRMQQQLLEYRLQQLDALVDVNISVAMLERLMGR